MSRATQIAKATGRGVLTATILASKAGKYGLNFTSGLAKKFLGGDKNLADQFAPGIDFGIGKYLYELGEKAASWGIDQTIALRKWLKGKLR